MIRGRRSALIAGALLWMGCGADDTPRGETPSRQFPAMIGGSGGAGGSAGSAMMLGGSAAAGVTGAAGGNAGAAGVGTGTAGSTAGSAGGGAGTGTAGSQAIAGTTGNAGNGMAGSAGAAGSTTIAGAGGSATMSPGEMGMSAGCGKTGAMTGAVQAEIMAADLMRGYFLSVPASYDANKPHRLVFGYHGSNCTGRMMRQYLDNEKAPLLANTIFVYPDGLPLPNQPSNIAWVLTDGGRDLVFFDTLLAHLEATYCIDLARIFVNGQSFGALMTNAVGCLRGDRIRAIAAVAGSGPRGGCKGQVAVWLTHGMDDMNVRFASGEASRDAWVANNHCMDMTTPGTPMQCLNYVGCDAGYPVIWCPHNADGGHQHPSFGRAAVREFLASF